MAKSNSLNFLNLEFYRVAMLISFAFISIGAFSQNKSLTLGSNIWPPFTNTKGNKAVSTDIVREALSRSGVKSEHTIKDFGLVMDGLKSASLDGCAAIWFTEERT